MPAGPRVVVDILGDRQLSRTLASGARRAADMSDGMDKVHGYLLEAARRQFASEGASGSGGWRPLAASTVRQKRGRGSILVRTGRLRRSLTQEGGEHVKVVTRSAVGFSSTVPYGRFHQSGTRHMPRRPPLELTELDRREAAKILQRSLIEGFR